MSAISISPDVIQAMNDATTARALSDLKVGGRGRVLRVLDDAEESMRLKGLGLCYGREIEVLRTGNAWVIRVLGSRIGISRKLAESVLLAAA